jgi:hypothetical protein
MGFLEEIGRVKVALELLGFPALMTAGGGCIWDLSVVTLSTLFVAGFLQGRGFMIRTCQGGYESDAEQKGGLFA